MISKNKYRIFFYIINLINYQTKEINNKISPLNNHIILEKNNLSIPLENNSFNNPVKYRTFKVVMVYILAIIGYIIPVSSWLILYMLILNSTCKNFENISIFKYIQNKYDQYCSSLIAAINTMFISTIVITIGLMILIYGWVTKKYIHNFIIQSWKYWILYIITLIIISLLPYIFYKISYEIVDLHAITDDNNDDE